MIETLAVEIQTAIASGDFESALPLISAYGKALKFAVNSTPSQDEKLQLLTEASALLQDRLHLARVIRAQLSARSLEASCLLSYTDGAASESWRLDA